MTPFTAAQLPEIARNILAERDAGREVDPHRIAWATDILAWSKGDAKAGERCLIEAPAAKKRHDRLRVGAPERGAL